MSLDSLIYPKWRGSLKRHRSLAESYVERQWSLNRNDLSTYVETGLFVSRYKAAEVIPEFENWEINRLIISAIVISNCFYVRHYLNAITGSESQLSDVGNSFLYGYIAYEIDAYMVYHHEIRFGDCYRSDYLEWLIPQITFGYLLNEDKRADQMAKLAIKSFHKSWMPYRQYPVFTFMLALLADYLGEAPIEFIGKASESVALQHLLKVWRDPSPENIRELCLAACDIHTHRCRIDSAKEFFEFNNLYLYEWPIAINLLFKLREKLGLQNPELDHPLMNSPLGKLPEVTPFEYDSLIFQVIERMKSQGFDEDLVFEKVYYEK